MSKGKVHLQREPRGDGARFARCNGFELPAGLPVHDPRRDRLTTDESAVTCDPCKEGLRAAVEEVIRAAMGDTPTPVRFGCRKAIPLRERDLEESPRFATWRSAVRAYVRARDEGVPIKSVSDPARFEATPQGTSMTYEGDTAQRQVHRLGEVSAAMELAFGWDAAAEIEHDPAMRVLGASLCLEVLVLRVVGRPYVRNPSNNLQPRKAAEGGAEEFRGVVRKKSWLAERGVFDSAEYASALSVERGVTITAGDLARIERSGGRRIEDELYRRGLVSLRDKGLWQREDEAMGTVLKGKAAIAKHLGMSEDTLDRAAEWDPPVPVRRVGRKFEADATELDTWRKKNPGPKRETAA